MTDSLFFDNDCMAAFLWVNREGILIKLYPGRIFIPKPVYDEFSVRGIEHIKDRLDGMITSGDATITYISTDSSNFDLYVELTMKPTPGHVIIGKGEAATIVLAKECNGIVASNNLRDVVPYINLYKLEHVTTGGILAHALKCGVITENEGNIIWQEMLRKKRKIGAATFTDYLRGSK